MQNKHACMIGYHNHAKVNFNSWDAAVTYSKYNALNLDVGHYVAVTNESPVPLIKKYADRMLNLHLKDRKKTMDPICHGEKAIPLWSRYCSSLKRKEYPFLLPLSWNIKFPKIQMPSKRQRDVWSL